MAEHFATNGNDQPARGVAIAGWTAVIALVGVEIYRRLVLGQIPPDMTAYLAAADVFGAGSDPYSKALFDSPYFAGYPYVYPPGTLPLVGLIDHLRPVAVATIDAVLRAGVAASALVWLHRRFSLEIPASALVLMAVFFQPFLADFSTGNLAIYLFGAFVLCVHLSEADWRAWHIPAGIAAGILLSFKPMWGLAVGLAIVARGRWRLAASVLAGALIVGGLTTMHWELVTSWTRRIGEVREFYRSFDLLSLAPSLLPVAVLAWLGAGVVLWRREAARPHLWLWACVSLVAWPRLATYSYVLLIPTLVWLWQRWGWRRAGVVALPAFGPLPWLVIGTDKFLYLGVLYGWALVVACVVFWELYGQGEATHLARDSDTSSTQIGP